MFAGSPLQSTKFTELSSMRLQNLLKVLIFLNG